MPLKQMPWRQVIQQESIKLLVLTTDLPWDRLPSHSLRLNQRPLRTAGHLQYYPRLAAWLSHGIRWSGHLTRWRKSTSGHCRDVQL